MFYRLPRSSVIQWSPTYFLAALGAGGLVVTFFMWLLFWLPHPETPVPVFENAMAILGGGAFPQTLAIIGAWLGIALFGALHIHLLIWNLRRYGQFRKTPAYRDLRQGNAETQLLAGPLTVAMTINVAFILGLTFVPGLWSVVEWLFPWALLAFVLIGIWALVLLRDFWGRVLVTGGFDCASNNNLGQLLPSFATSMIAVGLAAPSAMSQNAATVTVSLALSSFFMVLAMVMGAIQVVLGFRAMLEQGTNPDTAPSLWIVVPILTILSITLLRQTHGLDVHFGAGAGGVQALTMLTYFLCAQLVFGLLGWIVLARYGYFSRFVTGAEKSAGAYALVCPGVALAVMLHFYTNVGLVRFGAIERFGVGYWCLSAVALLLQFLTVWLVYRLNRLHFHGANEPNERPATRTSG